MTSNSHFHIGDSVTMHGGAGNVGMIKNQAQEPQDPQTAFREMLNMVHALRGQVSAEDRQALDESLNTIGAGNNVEPGTLRRALSNIAGVATMVGEVGIPVVQAVRRVMALFGG